MNALRWLGLATCLAVFGVRLAAQRDGFVVHRVALAQDATAAAFGRVTEMGGDGVLLWREAGAAEPRRLGRFSIVRGIAFAPDGSSVFGSDDRGAVHQVAVAGGLVRTFELGRLPGFCNDVAVSPDGKLLVAVDQEKRLQGFDIDTGVRRFAHTLAAQPLSLVFLPGGEFFVGDNGGGVTRWSVDGLQRDDRYTIDGNVMRLAVSADGALLAAAAWNGAMSVFDLATGERRDRQKTGQRIYALAFSPDGGLLAAAGGDQVVVWDLVGGREDQRPPSERTIGALAWRLQTGGRSAVLFGADYRGGIHELLRTPHEPYPRLVTAATRADAVELARLQTPGEVLFVDGFESERSFADYFEINGREQGRVVIADAVENVHSGKGALQLTATDNEGNSRGAGPVLWLGEKGPASGGYDCLHLRYWIRYAVDYDQGNLHHTGGSLSGVAGSNKWGGMGTAGLRPKGDDHFSTRVEGWRDWGRRDPPGYLHCYTYWLDMRQGRDGKYWGNMLAPQGEAERVVPQRGEWQCVELRVQCNTVDADTCHADGELAVWLDGELYVHYRSLRWRSDAAVALKRVGLSCYVHEARRDNTVWFDDMVVSTGYVGTGAVAAGK